MGDVKLATVMEGEAILEKLVKEITESGVVEANAGGGHGGITVTTGFLFNSQKGARKLDIIDEHHWSGELDETAPFPPSLEWDLTTMPPPFRHRGRIPEGSVAGVVYADGHDSTARKWLIAFDNPNRKVYVEAGPAGLVDWNVIKVKLDQSGSRSHYEDPILGGLAHGAFTEMENNVVHGLFYK
ncbi:hypothetical protein vseg_020803 [Gypsophila vaccaria]